MFGFLELIMEVLEHPKWQQQKNSDRHQRIPDTNKQSHPRLMHFHANKRRVEVIRLPGLPKLLTQFEKYPYFNYSKQLVRGHVREAMQTHTLSDSIQYISFIADLCQKYFFDEENAYDQLAYQIFANCKKYNKTSFSDKLLKWIVRKYLKIDTTAKLEFHCNELVRLKYIIRVEDKYDEDPFYVFTVSKTILFHF